jgi:hypothetical protein
VRLIDLQTGTAAGELVVPECPPFVRPDAMVFSDDGTELTFVFNWSNTSPLPRRLLAWDLRTGKVSADFRFEQGEISPSETVHRPVEVLRGGWLVRGSQFVDRKTGEVRTLAAGQPEENVTPLATHAVGPDSVLVVWETKVDRVPALAPRIVGPSR